VHARESARTASQETIVLGIEQVVPAFIGPFAGKNLGKMIGKLELEQ